MDDNPSVIYSCAPGAMSSRLSQDQMHVSYTQDQIFSFQLSKFSRFLISKKLLCKCSFFQKKWKPGKMIRRVPAENKMNTKNSAEKHEFWELGDELWRVYQCHSHQQVVAFIWTRIEAKFVFRRA